MAVKDKAIDFVITWVDDSDPAWRAERNRYAGHAEKNGIADNRFRDWNLLRYWFRGVEKFAPWVNHIYFVTCGHYPSWLNVNHPKLTVVSHTDYIPAEHLPTFNSNVIELYMHHIPGLSEQFVLFNDDMYVTSPVTPEDFFIGGQPCDAALMDTITADYAGNLLPYFQVNNFGIINQHFVKKEVLKQHGSKFFNMKYGKDLMRNILLGYFKYFSCFRDSHLPSSHLKSTFEKVWAAEGERLEASGMERFRSMKDYSHWLMKEWQICEGNFVPRPCSWGRHFELHEDTGVDQAIIKQQHKVVCLNDSNMDVQYEVLKPLLHDSFEKILPDISTYEIESERR